MFDWKHIFNTEFVEAHNEPIVGGGAYPMVFIFKEFSLSFFLHINVLAEMMQMKTSDYYYR